MVEGRSPHWPATRCAWLKNHPSCAACGRTDKLQVHHKKPFHVYPDLELDPRNFITLCENTPEDDHFEVGHNGTSWKDFNRNVEGEAAALLRKRTARHP